MAISLQALIIITAALIMVVLVVLVLMLMPLCLLSLFVPVLLLVLRRRVLQHHGPEIVAVHRIGRKSKTSLSMRWPACQPIYFFPFFLLQSFSMSFNAQ